MELARRRGLCRAATVTRDCWRAESYKSTWVVAGGGLSGPISYGRNSLIVTAMSKDRLRCERFETKPKRVIQAANFHDWINALNDPLIAARYNEFADCVAQGRIVPPNFYRRGIDRTPDDLLAQEGIKHIHLDEGGGDALMFVVEYDDAVVFLEINSHTHFSTQPPGSVLLSLHHNCLVQQDKDVLQRIADRIIEKAKIYRSGLLPRRRPTDAERPADDPHAKDE
jgi:hypothetical protein